MYIEMYIKESKELQNVTRHASYATNILPAIHISSNCQAILDIIVLPFSMEKENILVMFSTTHLCWFKQFIKHLRQGWMRMNCKFDILHGPKDTITMNFWAA